MHPNCDSLDYSNETITLYGLRNPDRKIPAIKTVRALGCIYGGKIGLKDAKLAVDNIIERPIAVSVPSHLLPIVQVALEAYFITTPQLRTTNVAALVDYDN